MENNQNDAGKEQKRFQANMQKLQTLLGGEDKLKPVKVSKANVANLVAEMLKEEEEIVNKTFKEKGKAIVKRYIDFTKFVKAQEAELKKKVTEQMKVFNTEVGSLFQLIEDHQNLQQSFAETLEGKTTEEPNEEETEEQN